MSRPSTIRLEQLQSAVESGVELALRDLTEREARETSAGALALTEPTIVTDPTTMGMIPPDPFPTEPTFAI